jgi:hypothetical protein
MLEGRLVLCWMLGWNLFGREVGAMSDVKLVSSGCSIGAMLDVRLVIIWTGSW